MTIGKSVNRYIRSKLTFGQKSKSPYNYPTENLNNETKNYVGVKEHARLWRFTWGYTYLMVANSQTSIYASLDRTQ